MLPGSDKPGRINVYAFCHAICCGGSPWAKSCQRGVCRNSPSPPRQLQHPAAANNCAPTDLFKSQRACLLPQRLVLESALPAEPAQPLPATSAEVCVVSGARCSLPGKSDGGPAGSKCARHIRESTHSTRERPRQSPLTIWRAGPDLGLVPNVLNGDSDYVQTSLGVLFKGVFAASFLQPGAIIIITPLNDHGSWMFRAGPFNPFVRLTCQLQQRRPPPTQTLKPMFGMRHLNVLRSKLVAGCGLARVCS
jgi:hypothetical protein